MRHERLRERMTRWAVLVLLFAAGCSGIPHEADKARYSAARSSYEMLAVPAVQNKTLNPDDFAAAERMYDAWAAAIKSREQ